MKNNDTKVRHRNRLHDHPLMRKGGVHQKSNKALRRAARQALQRKWDEQKALSTVVCAYPTCREWLRQRRDLYMWLYHAICLPRQ